MREARSSIEVYVRDSLNVMHTYCICVQYTAYWTDV